MTNPSQITRLLLLLFSKAKGERSSSKAREIVEKFAENIREEFILKGFNRIKLWPHEWKIIDFFEEKYGFFETTLSNNNIRGIFLHLIKTGNVIILKDYQVIKESEKQLTRAQKHKQNNDGNKRTKQIKDK